MEKSNTQATTDMTNNEQIINKENNMNENHEQETINQETTNQEDTMPETNTTTTNITNDELKEFYSAIKEDYAGLNENEKSSAVKSYNMGHNLNMLHKDNQYRNLTENNGNQFKNWQTFCEEGCGFTRAYADRLMKCNPTQDMLERMGVTSIKQSVANLYMLYTAKTNDPDLDLAEVWKKATGDNPEAFPSRNAVQKAINPEFHAPKRTTKIANDLPSLLSALKAFTLSDEDKQQVRQVLDELLNAGSANPIQEESPETTITAEPVKLSA